MGFQKAIEVFERIIDKTPGRLSDETQVDSFEAFLRSDPTGFSEKAVELNRQASAEIRRFLGASMMRVKDGKEINLAEALRLCQWVRGPS